MKVGDKVAVYRDRFGKRTRERHPHTIVAETEDGKRWFLEEHFTSQWMVFVALKEDVEPWKN
jgi:hypothetical protein